MVYRSRSVGRAWDIWGIRCRVYGIGFRHLTAGHFIAILEPEMKYTLNLLTRGMQTLALHICLRMAGLAFGIFRYFPSWVL